MLLLLTGSLSRACFGKPTSPLPLNDFHTGNVYNGHATGEWIGQLTNPKLGGFMRWK